MSSGGAMCRLLVVALIIAGASYALWVASEPHCGATTPGTFVVSTDPYVCDFTRGGGPI